MEKRELWVSTRSVPHELEGGGKVIFCQDIFMVTVRNIFGQIIERYEEYSRPVLEYL